MDAAAGARLPWFARRFQFDLPPENALDVVVRLHGAPLRLDELCAGLPRAAAVARDGDRWSIQENAGHLFDLEPLWSERTEQIARGDGVLAAADLQNRRTHEARHNERELRDLLAAFAAARRAWTRRLASLAPAEFARAARHPRLDQSMRLVDLCGFVAAHDDHHLARIWALRRAAGG